MQFERSFGIIDFPSLKHGLTKAKSGNISALYNLSGLYSTNLNGEWQDVAWGPLPDVAVFMTGANLDSAYNADANIYI